MISPSLHTGIKEPDKPKKLSSQIRKIPDSFLCACNVLVGIMADLYSRSIQCTVVSRPTHLRPIEVFPSSAVMNNWHSRTSTKISLKMHPALQKASRSGTEEMDTNDLVPALN